MPAWNEGMNAAAESVSLQALTTENEILKQRVAMQNTAGRALLTLCLAQAIAIAVLIVWLILK